MVIWIASRRASSVVDSGMSMRRQIFRSSMRSRATRSLTAPFRRSSIYPTRLGTGIGHRQPAPCMLNMTGSFRIWALVSSSRPRLPPRLTQLLMTRLLLAAALLAAFLLSPLPTAADARFPRLSEPGIVAILRHAFAPGTEDPATFALDDCTTQRNLDAQGRERALAITDHADVVVSLTTQQATDSSPA